MLKTELKESSRRFLHLLKLSLVSFVSMGVLIGYHGAPLINSMIGAVWFVFVICASLVVIGAIRSPKHEGEWQLRRLSLPSLEK